MSRLTADLCADIGLLLHEISPDCPEAHIHRIAAAALRWYAKTETGGDDHAERQAMIAACKEATWLRS